MVIFHSYVSLPEGNPCFSHEDVFSYWYHWLFNGKLPLLLNQWKQGVTTGLISDVLAVNIFKTHLPRQTMANVPQVSSPSHVSGTFGVVRQWSVPNTAINNDLWGATRFQTL